MLRTWRLFAAAALLLAATSATAQSKEPWQWSTEERIAARTDPALARARVREAMVRGSASAMMATNSGHLAAITDVIDGSVHPELFMPHELFKRLIQEGYVGDSWRDLYDNDDLKRANLPADFWDGLEDAAGAYIADLRREAEQVSRAKTMTPAQIERLNARLRSADERLCRDRAAAYKKAYERYGDSLLRFMYTRVADSMSIAIDDRLDAQVLRAREEGCTK